jgi:photosystem II stability/assembly factor-like uncharacterized protein
MKKHLQNLSILLALLFLIFALAIYQFTSPNQVSITQPKALNLSKKSLIVPKKETQTNKGQKLESILAPIQTEPKSEDLLAQLEKERADYANFITNHPYHNRKETYQEIKKIPKQDRPDLAMELDFLKTVDPQLKSVPRERLLKAYPEVLKRAQESENTDKAAIPGVSWTERGPNNVGGRTRALMFDPNDANRRKVWAGGVSGGLWFNDDITNAASTWQRVDDFWSNLAVTTIAADPTNPQIFYVGTGEGHFNFDAVQGGGIWKTTNGGQTWTQLANTIPTTAAGGNAILQSFVFVQKIVVNSTGEVFAATRSNFNNRGGILKSTNGGNTWTRVLAPRSGVGITADATMSDWGADIELANNGDLYASVGLGPFSNMNGKVYRSTSGGTSWLDITPATNGQRVELAIAPSTSGSTSSTVVYAVASHKSPVSVNSDIAWFGVTDNGGATWFNVNIPIYTTSETGGCATSGHFTRSQAWYDLTLAVHPTNPNLVFAGGIDVHRSTDAGNVWATVSNWRGICNRPYVHADIHSIVFRPGNSNEIIVGTDGGVSYSSNAGNSAVSNPTFADRNSGYNITQFYSLALRNVTNSNYTLGGTQDNGTQRFAESGSATTTTATDGDGGFCFIDQQNPNIQFTAFTNNNISRSTNGGTSFSTMIADDAGKFINPADYDNQNKTLFTAGNTDELRRVLDANTVTFPANQQVINIDLIDNGAEISAIRANTFTANRVFIGTDAGRVFRVDGATGNNPTVAQITGTINPGYISNIDVGSSDNELLVTVSNYGVRSIYYTTNGGTTWTSKDEAGQGLPDIPVRWGIFNPKNTRQVILATELGVWSTSDITATNPGWEPTPVSGSSRVANVRCDMLKFRNSDNLLAVATHGRGVYTTLIPNPDFSASQNVSYLNTNITFTDQSSGTNSWAWNFGSGATPATANTQGPHQVQYNSVGNKAISLTIGGNLSRTRNVFILPNKNTSYLIADGGNFENNTDFAPESLNAGLQFERGNSSVSGKNGVASSSNAWVTNLVGNYPDNAEARLYSPNFDFSKLGLYTLQFKTKFQTESLFDGFIVEVSTNRGASWTRLGNSVANNWYNSTKSGNGSTGGFTAGTPFFSGTTVGYETKSFDVSSFAGQANVAFRFVFKSDEAIIDAGVALDDFNLTYVDNIPPTLSSFTPAHTSIDIPNTANLTLTFSEAVQKGSGNILIRRVSNNAIDATIAITSNEVTVNNNLVTINPAQDLGLKILYNVEIQAGAIRDLANNNYAGINNNTTWRFTTHEIPNAIEDDLLSRSIRLFPNPSIDKIVIEADNLSNLKFDLKLINARGETVLEQKQLELNSSNELNINQLTNGVYWLKLETSQGRKVVRKFVKQ